MVKYMPLLILLPMLLFSQGKAGHGSSLLFDGNGDYINCGTGVSLNITDVITIETWIKANAGTNYGIIHKQDLTNDQPDYGLIFSSERKILFRLNQKTTGDGQVTGGTQLTYGKWYYIVGTSNGITMNLYVNTVIDGTNNAVSPINTNIYPLYIGVYYSSSYSFNGMIDEVRIYRRVLSSSEILWNYNHPDRPYSTDSLKGYWKMNEYTGTVVGDSSGNGNTGNITNATWSFDTPVISGKEQ